MEAVTLTGNHVHLVPLSGENVDGLCDIGLDDELWQWTPKRVVTRQQMRDYVAQALDERDRGVALPFVIESVKDNLVAGCTRFGNIDLQNRRLEIGWTWLGRQWQRTAINTETKLLMLMHAFEVLKVNRVELKTDALNERSRRAILRIGAKQEGILRKHVVTESGRLRDTVCFSVIDDEWPTVKAHLQQRLVTTGKH